MRILTIALLIFLSSCQDFNSNSFDDSKYGNDSSGETDPNFAPAFEVLRTECISCHQGYHNAWASRKTNEAWISSGLVTAGDAANSALIEAMVNSGTPGANMPPTGAIDNNKYLLLQQWINNIP